MKSQLFIGKSSHVWWHRCGSPWVTPPFRLRRLVPPVTADPSCSSGTRQSPCGKTLAEPIVGRIGLVEVGLKIWNCILFSLYKYIYIMCVCFNISICIYIYMYISYICLYVNKYIYISHIYIYHIDIYISYIYIIYIYMYIVISAF